MHVHPANPIRVYTFAIAVLDRDKANGVMLLT
jgi:hypothetical protein